MADAVAKVYGFLSSHARVIGPSPAYSTHSSAESAHCALPHITYDLDPDNGWMPDLADLRSKIETIPLHRRHPLINPNNPTGAVYPPRGAGGDRGARPRVRPVHHRRRDLHPHGVPRRARPLHLSEVIGDVPAIVMRGISKELPWPGSRCGWIEVLNRSGDQNFSAYVDTLVAAKRLEVCSTSGPQLTVPRIFGDSRYAGASDGGRAHVRRAGRRGLQHPERRARHQAQPGPGRLLHDGRVRARSARRQEHACPSPIRRSARSSSGSAEGVAPDARFVYYLLASTGICVVPLSGFCSPHPGFRFTLLETDDAKREWTLRTLANSLEAYLESGRESGRANA